jgi:hypothetical protein
MFASDLLNRGAAGPRRLSRNRRNGERRTRSRLRDLCDEVLASYRLAQGEDLVSSEDREAAHQVLRRLTPQVIR